MCGQLRSSDVRRLCVIPFVCSTVTSLCDTICVVSRDVFVWYHLCVQQWHLCVIPFVWSAETSLCDTICVFNSDIFVWYHLCGQQSRLCVIPFVCSTATSLCDTFVWSAETSLCDTICMFNSDVFVWYFCVVSKDIFVWYHVCCEHRCLCLMYVVTGQWQCLCAKWGMAWMEYMGQCCLCMRRENTTSTTYAVGTPGTTVPQ
jgi:hypothetical protein